MDGERGLSSGGEQRRRNATLAAAARLQAPGRAVALAATDRPISLPTGAGGRPGAVPWAAHPACNQQECLGRRSDRNQPLDHSERHPSSLVKPVSSAALSLEAPSSCAHCKSVWSGKKAKARATTCLHGIATRVFCPGNRFMAPRGLVSVRP